MKIEFSTNEYQFSHGSTPKGRGSWAFQVIDINGHDGEAEVHFSSSMTYAQAKKWVAPVIKAEVATIFGDDAHHVTVNVCP